MEYISVVWKHSSPSDSIRLVSELDEERYERRKLEFYADGTVGAASDDFEDARTQLGIVAVPALSEINEDTQFQGVAITQGEFDELWQQNAPPFAHRR